MTDNTLQIESLHLGSTKVELTEYAKAEELEHIAEGKQDVIEDLDSIRSGASLGATALQSFTETDPTVPSWAKESTKPSYTPQEIGAAASAHTHEMADVSGLTAELSGKASVNHTHQMADVSGLTETLEDMSFVTSSHINELHSDVERLTEEKQDTLVAGSGITISGNTISATGGGGGEIIETTCSELKELRDSSGLTPGMEYRITDYECKVEGTLSGMYAKSENNKYDIIVEAIDEHTLSQDAKAMNHVPEEPEHEVTEVTKFKFFSDMGAGGSRDMYGFMIRNKAIDGTNTSTDEKMADCQIGWSMITETFQGQFDSASTFDDVTSWTPYAPDMVKIFTLNSDITAGETAYMDASIMGGSGVIEFSILDTLEETHTEGGDYFKNCNLDAWELKYSLDLNDHRFEWVSTKTGIAISVDGQRFILSRNETYDTYGKWVVNIPIEGTTYQFLYNGRGGVEESGVTYYCYELLDEVEPPEGYVGVILFTTEFPVVGDNGYFDMSDKSLQPFTFTQEMVSTKNTAWTTTMYGATIGALTEELPQVGDLCSVFQVYEGMIEIIPEQFPISEVKDASSYKGVVYYMKDEWNNECPYDFKNIKFGRNEFNDSDYPDLCYGNENNTFNFLYNGAPVGMSLDYFYTFALKDLATGNWHDATVAASIGLKEGISSMVICKNNKIKPTCMIGLTPLNVQYLNGDVFFNVFEDLSNVSTVSDGDLACNCINNTIEGMKASFGTFGANAIDNKVSGSGFIFGNYAVNNVKAFSENEETYYGNNTQNILPPSTNIFTNFWKGTQEEYDAMGEYGHDSKTLYIITEE